MKFKKSDVAKMSMSHLGYMLIVELVGNNKNVLSSLDNKDDELDFTCQINGIEVNPKTFFDHIHKQWDEIVAKEAQKIVNSKIDESLDIFNDLTNKFKNVVAERLGLPTKNPWDY